MEELKIVDAYAPSDPWVHAQMALVYHDLGDIEHEIAEYELLTRISPSDGNLRYRLGVLYFQMGKPSLGLKIYEELKSASDPRADGLIAQYTHY
jgi:tetratricopeptide (TPR) repeat protein